MHLLDIENLVGGIMTRDAVARAWREYVAAVPTVANDDVIVAVASRHHDLVRSVVPADVHLVRGENIADGADAALVGAFAEWETGRHAVDRVVIASCDHYFAPLASRLRAQSVDVVQVIGIGTSSTALYRACPSQIYLRTRLRGVSRSRGSAPMCRVADRVGTLTALIEQNSLSGRQ